MRLMKLDTPKPTPQRALSHNSNEDPGRDNSPPQVPLEDTPVSPFLATFAQPKTRTEGPRYKRPQTCKRSGSQLPQYLCSLAAALGLGQANAWAATGPSAGHPVSLAPIVAEVIAGVVNIRTSDRRPPGNTSASPTHASPDALFGMFLGTRPAGDGGSESAASRSMGSGFFLRDTSTIVTNHHVIKDAASIVVFATELQIYRKAQIVGVDRRMDLALLRVRPVPGAKALTLGSSANLRPGDPLFAIGNPFGYGNSVSSGILSAKGRAVGTGSLGHLLQTDVPLNPGNSGGPLFDLNGSVVGINTANVVEAQGISFAIPAEVAAGRLASLAAGREKNPRSVSALARPWMGLLAENITDSAPPSNETYGVVIRSVIKNSPADKAGLLKGDVIRSLLGSRLLNVGQLEAALAEQNAGETIELSVYRQGQSLAITLILRPFPDTLAASGNNSVF